MRKPLLLKVLLYKVKQYKIAIMLAYIYQFIQLNLFLSFLLAFQIPYGLSTPEQLMFFLYDFLLFPPSISLFGINFTVTFRYVPLLVALHVALLFILSYISPFYISLIINSTFKKKIIDPNVVASKKYFDYFTLYLIIILLSYVPYFWYTVFEKIFNYILLAYTFVIIVASSPFLFSPVALLFLSIKEALIESFNFSFKNKHTLLEFCITSVILIGIFALIALIVGQYSTGWMLFFILTCGFPFSLFLSVFAINIYVKNSHFFKKEH